MLNHIHINSKKTKNILSSKDSNLVKKLLELSNFVTEKKHNRIDNSFYFNDKLLFNSCIYYRSPLNLLFSIDQFFFEFSKKFPQRKKTSEFKLQLKERKKLSLFYGSLSKKQLSQIINESNFYKGHTSKKILSLLEHRLDVVLYRGNFAPNIITAKQYISHKKILVNNRCITIPSYRLNSGDIISMTPQNFTKIGSSLLNTVKGKIRKRDSLHFITKDILKKWIDANIILLKKDLEFFLELLIKKIHSRINIIISEDALENRFMSYFNKDQYFIIFKFKSISSKQNEKINELIFQEKQDTVNPRIQLTSISQTIDMLTSSQKRLTRTPVYKKSLLECTSLSKFEKKSIVEFYRKLLLHIILGFNYKKISREFFILNLKKHLSKKREKNYILNALKIAGVKPLHLEISYKLLKIIFLYSPQRIYYPFFIDIDLIKRSYKK